MRRPLYHAWPQRARSTCFSGEGPGQAGTIREVGNHLRAQSPLQSPLFMSSPPPGPIPQHTVVASRAQTDRLAAQHFHLVLLDTERAGTVYPLSGEELRIGKAPDNDVVIDHPTVSRN